MARDGRERTKTCTWNRVCCNENNNATVGSGAVGIAAGAATPATPTAKRPSHCCFRFLCTVCLLRLRAASLPFAFLLTHAHAAKQKKRAMRVILTIYPRRYIRCDFSQQVVSSQPITIYFVSDFCFCCFCSDFVQSVLHDQSIERAAIDLDFWIRRRKKNQSVFSWIVRNEEISSVRKIPKLKQFAHCPINRVSLSSHLSPRK